MASVVAGIVAPMIIESLLKGITGNGKHLKGSGVPKRTKKGIVYESPMMYGGRQWPRRHKVRACKIRRHRRHRRRR